MANIFDKTTTIGTDRTLVLDQRESLIYPFPFTDWNVIRIGGIFSFTTASDDNGDVSALGGPNAEFIITPTAGNERIWFGVKHNNSNFPGTNGEPFVGINNPDQDSHLYVINSPGRGLYIGGRFSENPLSVTAVHGNGTYEFSNSGGQNVLAPWTINDNQFHATSNFAYQWALTLAVNNKGLATQNIGVSTYFQSNTIGTNTDNQTLKNILTNSSYTNRGTVNWNLSGLPYDLPNTFFLHWPFTNTRLRIHNIGIVKVS